MIRGRGALVKLVKHLQAPTPPGKLRVILNGIGSKALKTAQTVAFNVTVLNLALAMTVVGYSMVAAVKIYRFFRPVQVRGSRSSTTYTELCMAAHSLIPS